MVGLSCPRRLERGQRQEDQGRERGRGRERQAGTSVESQVCPDAIGHRTFEGTWTQTQRIKMVFGRHVLSLVQMV